MARISAKNQVTIPVAVLEEAGLHAGDQVVVEALEEGELRIRRGELGFERAFGALNGNDPHHARARTLFRSWQRHDDDRLISVVNLTEVLIAPAADRRRLR